MELTNDEILNEKWEKISGFPNYEVSNMGRVKSKNFSVEKILRQSKKRKGKLYCYVNIIDEAGIQKTKKVHRLVALTFIGPEPDGHEVDHDDANPENNRATNLVYRTRLDNLKKSRFGPGKRRPSVSRAAGFVNPGWFQKA